MTNLLLQPQAGAAARAELAEDRRLRDDIERALVGTGHHCLLHVNVTVRGDLVTLRGRVPSYYLKQLAQSAALTLTARRELRNELMVFEPECGTD